MLVNLLWEPTAGSQFYCSLQVTIPLTACLKSTTNCYKSYCTHIHIHVNLSSFLIYMSYPLKFPEPLPHTSLSVFGSTSVSLILPTIQARPVMEWKYKSRLPITPSFKAVKAGTILTSLEYQRWVYDPNERMATQWLCDGYREGHWARLKSHLPKDFSAMGMGKSAFVFFWDLEP